MKLEYIESCLNLVQTRDDLDNKEKLEIHKIAISKIRKIVFILKTRPKEDCLFLVELLHHPNEVVRIQASYALLLELNYKKGKARKTLKDIKVKSSNPMNSVQADNILKKDVDFFYVNMMIISFYLTFSTIISLAIYYLEIKKDHSGPMDTWAAVLMFFVAGIYMLLIMITRKRKITVFDGSRKAVEYLLPVIWIVKVLRFIILIPILIIIWISFLFSKEYKLIQFMKKKGFVNVGSRKYFYFINGKIIITLIPNKEYTIGYLSEDTKLIHFHESTFGTIEERTRLEKEIVEMKKVHNFKNDFKIDTLTSHINFLKKNIDIIIKYYKNNIE